MTNDRAATTDAPPSNRSANRPGLGGRPVADGGFENTPWKVLPEREKVVIRRAAETLASLVCARSPDNRLPCETPDAIQEIE
jgi:hypothetical protein